MTKKRLTLASLALLLALLCGALPTVSLQAASQPPTVAQAEPPSPALAPEALANATYQSQVTADGTVTLTDGTFEDTENQLLATLASSPMAYGTLNGQDVAAVLLWENSGGSGIFATLEIMADQDGVPTVVASAFLGDRVDVISLTIADDQVVVEMVTQGPDDPMCCPTQLVRQTYTLDGDQLTMANEEVLGSAPQLALDNAPEGYSVTIVPPTPYDNSMPPGPTGAPLHSVIAFGAQDPATAMADGNPYIAVYPAPGVRRTLGRRRRHARSRTRSQPWKPCSRRDRPTSRRRCPSCRQRPQSMTWPCRPNTWTAMALAGCASSAVWRKMHPQW